MSDSSRWLARSLRRKPLGLIGVVGGIALFAGSIAATRGEPGQTEKPAAKPEKPAAAKETKPAATKPADAKPDSAEAAIRAAAKTFAEDFNRHDAAAVAAHWTPEGRLTEEDGNVLKGREAIAKAYSQLFAQHAGLRLSVRIESIHFPSAEIAEEEGTSQVSTASGEVTTAGRYLAIHIRQGDEWKLASVRESSLATASPSHRLKGLEFLVGDWTTTQDKRTVRINFRWVANRCFLQQTNTVTEDGVTSSSGIHLIGWDPEAGQFRTWAFDSTGGFGSGLWTPTENGYRIDSYGLLADGTPTSSHEVLIHVAGENTVLGWKSFDRMVGDVELPDTAEVVLDRVAGK